MLGLWRKVAIFVSIFLSPLTLIPILLWIILKTSVSETDFLKVALLVYGVGLLPVIVSLFFLKITRRISDWGISRREERQPLIAVGLLSIALTLSLLGTFPDIAKILLFLLSGGVVFFLITMFWKISAHTSSATIFYILMPSVVTFPTWAGLVLIVSVIWSRVYLRRHSFFQAVSGVLLSLLVFDIGRFFGIW